MLIAIYCIFMDGVAYHGLGADYCNQFNSECKINAFPVALPRPIPKIHDNYLRIRQKLHRLFLFRYPRLETDIIIHRLLFYGIGLRNIPLNSFVHIQRLFIWLVEVYRPLGLPFKQCSAINGTLYWKNSLTQHLRIHTVIALYVRSLFVHASYLTLSATKSIIRAKSVGLFTYYPPVLAACHSFSFPSYHTPFFPSTFHSATAAAWKHACPT